MKINAQILAVNKKKDQTAYLVCGCSLQSMIDVSKFVDDVSVEFFIEGAEDSKIIGEVQNFYSFHKNYSHI